MAEHDDSHHYAAQLAWSGSTGAGYDAYDRTHDLAVGGHRWRGSSDVAFRGDPSLTNPEDLLVAAASACQLLSFLAVAARARLDVVEYRDDAIGVMPEGNRPMWVTRIDLRPTITVRVDSPAGAEPDPTAQEALQARLHHLSEVAHRECFIAASLRTEIVVAPTFTIQHP